MSAQASQIRQFVPECADGEEMELRTALLVARDYAAMLCSRVATEWARALATEAHERAGQFAFAHTSLDRLKVTRDYCRNLVQAAMLTDWMDRSNWLDFGVQDQ